MIQIADFDDCAEYGIFSNVLLWQHLDQKIWVVLAMTFLAERTRKAVEQGIVSEIKCQIITASYTTGIFWNFPRRLAIDFINPN